MSGHRREHLPRTSQDTRATSLPSPPTSPNHPVSSRAARQSFQVASSGLQSTSQHGQTAPVAVNSATALTQNSASHLSQPTRRPRHHPYSQKPFHNGPAKRMRNLYDQNLYDRFGDGSQFKSMYTTDETLFRMYRAQGIPESRWDAELDKFDEMVNARMRANPTVPVWGLKPHHDQTTDIHRVDIDGTHLSIRFFNGGLEKQGAWLFDFFDFGHKCSVNSLPGWKVFVTPLTPGSKSLMFTGEVKSWEENHGIPKDQIKPGEERFSVPEDVTCKLEGPRNFEFWFQTPKREYTGPAVRIAKPRQVSRN